MKNIERITVHEVNFDILDTLLIINFGSDTECILPN